ncbi:MAG: hypothetical protein DHS20C19_10380 [Acidimicrobiales bacterium]|nr:MAG: hypothetical protein DHS20C19_10380 [Acidimicrobiales bacterium]
MMFLAQPPSSDGADQLLADDRKYMGFEMNVSTLWSWQPESNMTLMDLMGSVSAGLSMRERGILVAATAATIEDSYCSLAWGGKLAKEADGEFAAAVLRGDDADLTDQETALAQWARKVASNANGTTQADVDDLRAAGFDDAAIFGITAFVGLRIAFSKINGALGVRPDSELRSFSPPAVIEAVDFGRPIADD